jgi:hypothetical protein
LSFLVADENVPATIGWSIRYADGASYFRLENWIATDDFNANTEVLAGILGITSAACVRQDRLVDRSQLP